MRQLSDEGLALFRGSMSCDDAEAFNVGGVVMARSGKTVVLAEIVRKCKDNVYRVIYLEYGNYENVHVKDIESIHKDKLEKVDIGRQALGYVRFRYENRRKIEGGVRQAEDRTAVAEVAAEDLRCSTDDHTRKSRAFGNDSRKGRVVCADWKKF